jgi:hypothetical protein
MPELENSATELSSLTDGAVVSLPECPTEAHTQAIWTSLTLACTSVSMMTNQAEVERLRGLSGQPVPTYENRIEISIVNRRILPGEPIVWRLE